MATSNFNIDAYRNTKIVTFNIELTSETSNYDIVLILLKSYEVELSKVNKKGNQIRMTVDLTGSKLIDEDEFKAMFSYYSTLFFLNKISVSF